MNTQKTINESALSNVRGGLVVPPPGEGLPINEFSDFVRDFFRRILPNGIPPDALLGKR